MLRWLSIVSYYDDPYDFKERQEQRKLNSALMSVMWITSTQENYITCEPTL